jgi:eukaryotic-like serine/threonine-protein kinase
MLTWNPRANELFLKAVPLRSLEKRQALLDQECGADEALRAEIERLLEASDRAGSFLDWPAVKVGITTLAPRPGDETAGALLEAAGSVIGSYTLLQQIGEGGMGTVYMAEQTQPVRRKVALKVIKPGMDTRHVIARFEAERQALAMMDHVNIARVLDAGATESGRPYFVMELVHGVPITKYCDDNNLTPRERLELFVPVCQAIQHAHQKGIIHRDIKPSNVMITLYDGKPVPKVIDFGVAKATEQSLTERTLFTQYGTMLGTPEYMSPEQAEMSALGVDTRSDIYSLGVLLYELLTGNTPLSHKRVREAAYGEIIRLIREEEPPRPSTRLSDSGEALASISAHRHMEPAKLMKLLRGELDWIVMKTLEKDRNRRYETASGFAADVRRYLDDEPVQACPPSALYRLRKFARRNKRALAMVAVATAALLIVAATLGWSVRDRQARESAISVETARRLALTEQGIRQALERGTQSGADLHAILKKPGGVQQLLNQPARWELLIKTAHGELAQVQQLSVRAEGRLDAEIRQAINRLERQLASDQADHELVLRLEKIRLDRATWAEGEFANRKAADLYPKAFSGLMVLNRDPVAVGFQLSSSPIKDQLVAALDDWAWVAFLFRNPELVEQLLAVSRQLAPDPAWGDRLRQPKAWRDRETLCKLVAEAPTAGLSPQLLDLVGSLLRDERSLKESWLRRAQALHPADFWLSFSLAMALQETNPIEAAGFLRVALAVRPGNSAVYNNLGINLKAQQRLPEAIAAYRAAIALNPNDDQPYNNLGSALLAQKKPDEAIAACRKAILLNPKNARAHTNIGAALAAQQKLPEAIAAHRRAIEIDPKYALAYYNLGVNLAAQHTLPEAIAAYHKSIELDPKDGDAHNNLGIALREHGKLVEAIAAHRRATLLDPKSAKAHNNLAVALSKHGEPDEAIASYRKAIEIDPKYVNAHQNLGIVLAKQAKHDEAIVAYRNAIALDPKLAAAQKNLGNVLTAQGKLDEAIACYRKAIELAPNSARSREALGLALAKKGWDLASSPEPKHRDIQRAVEASNEAVEVTPQTSLAWQYLGWVRYRAGDWNASIEALERSCKLQPGGTGDFGQWIVMSLAHEKLSSGQSGSEQERDRHKAEARRFYDQAVKQIGSRAWAKSPFDQALQAFQSEAAELLGVKVKPK